MKKVLPIIVIRIITVGAASFYGGMKYSQSQVASWGAGGARFSNLTPEERQTRFQGMENSSVIGQRGGSAGGFLRGEILSKDDKSLTVKLSDGGSRIVFFSGSTAITKSASSSADELKIGEEVMVSGSQNADGSFNASAIFASPSF